MVNVTVRGGGRFEAILAVDFLIDDYTESYQRNDYRGDNLPWTQYLTADAFRAQLQFVLTLSDALELSAAAEPTVSPDSTPDPNASSPAESSDASSPSTGSPTAAPDSFRVTIARFDYEPPTWYEVYGVGDPHTTPHGVLGDRDTLYYTTIMVTDEEVCQWEGPKTGPTGAISCSPTTAPDSDTSDSDNGSIPSGASAACHQEDGADAVGSGPASPTPSVSDVQGSGETSSSPAAGERTAPGEPRREGICSRSAAPTPRTARGGSSGIGSSKIHRSLRSSIGGLRLATVNSFATC